MVINEGTTLPEGQKTEHEAQGWIEQTQHSLSDPVYHHLLHMYLNKTILLSSQRETLYVIAYILT